MQDRVETTAESLGGQTEMHSAAQEAYADHEFYRGVFSQSGTRSASSYWYNSMGSRYTGQDDAMIIFRLVAVESAVRTLLRHLFCI